MQRSIGHFNTQRVDCAGQGNFATQFVSYSDGSGTHLLPGFAVFGNPTSGCKPVTQYTGQFTDGSGFAVNLSTTAPGTITTNAGTVITPSNGYVTPSTYSLTDIDGNKVSINSVTSGQTTTATYTDSLGVTELTGTFTNAIPGASACVGAGPNGAGNGSFQYQYPTATGNAEITVNCQQVTILTQFGCNVSHEYGTLNGQLVTSIVLGDGSQMLFTYESQSPGTYTGRLATVTYPGGKTVTYASYAYTGPNNGINCLDGSTAGLTRTDSDGTYTFTRNTTTWLTTTMVGPVPANNKSVYVFTTGINAPNATFLTQETDYQGSTTALKTTVMCYNTNLTNCPTAAAPTYPITQTDTFLTLGGMTTSSRSSKTFDAYGNLTKTAVYDFGLNVPSSQTVTSYGQAWNGTACTSYPSGTNIRNTPCYSHIINASGADVAKTQITYDNKGHAKTTAKWTGGSSWLTSTATYNPNGTLATATDVNGALSTYAYGTGGCNNLLPTSVNVTGQYLLSGGLTTSQQWDCNGAVVASATDANGQITTYDRFNPTTTVADPFWRVDAMISPYNGTTRTTTNYSYSPTTLETSLVFNNNASTMDVLSTADALGRVISTQNMITPGSSSYDGKVQYGYGWNATGSILGPFSTQTVPGGSALTTTQLDALGRTASVTDGGGGSTSFAYIQNDVQATTSSPSTSRQTEYDGLGRIKSVCEVSTQTGSAPCGQNTPHNGYLTTYAYDTPVTNAVTMTQNANGTSQQRIYYYDGIGRLTKEANPENGTVQYIYDTNGSTTCGGFTSNGDLMERIDNAGAHICYGYDALHRLLGFDNTLNSNSVGFAYDTAVSPPTGVTVSNTAGRMVEALTNSTSSGVTKIVTDEWFGYSPRGEVTDVYESTPNSNGYYHTKASYFANGALQSLTGVPSHTAGWTFGVDGEGRPNTAVDQTSSTNLVTNATYYPSTLAPTVTLGTGETDIYGYDANTGRMNSYQFMGKVAGTAKYVNGTLGWNANGTLGSLGITDQFDSANAQSCTYGYDDLVRLASVNCGASIWQQTFTYDPFGNITKSGSVTWQPGYNPVNNHIALAGTSYDPNGNLLNDLSHQYTWDAYGKLASIDLSTACGTDGTCLTYDALGRMVEQNRSGTYSEILYSPIGKLALMNRQITQTIFVPLPGGEQATYSGGTLRFRHSDWLGTYRFETNASEQEYGDVAYAPFGENYAVMNTPYLGFTGQNQDTAAGLYDFLYREYNPTQGRWISPDPAGLNAVDLSNPQSFNRYSYVLNNPLRSLLSKFAG
jgi:RHS repeat-associated protein